MEQQQKYLAAFKRIPFHYLPPSHVKELKEAIDESLKVVRKRVVDLKLKNRDMNMRMHK